MGPRVLMFALVCLSLLFALSGCSSKKTLDKQVDSMIESLQDDDYDAFQKLLNASLKSEVSRDEFGYLSMVIKRLGDFEDRTMEGIEVNNDRKEGRYELEFEEGTVNLRLTLTGEKIIGFEFSGSTFDNAAEAVWEELHENQPPPETPPK